MDFEYLFTQNKELSISGRYLTLEAILPLLKKKGTNYKAKVIGFSVLKKPIYDLIIGHGATKILLWSQMHGNESTTTKALFDFINLLISETDLAQQLLDTYTFYCIPMLNPDGADRYTRVNANEVDLNRDAQHLTQPESILLRNVFNEFKPHFCYNLHDQRTIFGVGDTGKPATVSFLAPSYNQACEVNETRMKAIRVVSRMNKVLQGLIPGQIGRFDDAFNINCIGDTFQSLNVPTILFEAGHFPFDYQREETRKYVFISLVAGLIPQSENDVVVNEFDEYLNISQNKVCFYDFLYKNIKINYDGIEIITNFAAQYKEELIDQTISFIAYIVEVGDLNGFFGHYEYDAKGAFFTDYDNNYPNTNQKADFELNNGDVFVNGLLQKKL